MTHISGTRTRSTLSQRLVVVLAGVVAAVLVWLIADPILGNDLATNQGTSVGVANVVLSSLLAGLAGWGLLAVLERFTGRPGLIWTVIALVVLLASLSGPITGAAGTATRVTLIAMHLVLGAVVIPGLARTAATAPRSARA